MVRTEGLFFVIFGYIVIFLAVAPAAETEALFSENTASVFIKQASEVYSDDPLDPENVQQAMAFLEAVYALNPNSKDIPEQMLRVMAGSCYSGVEYSKYFNWALGRYLTSRSDLVTALGALGCMLESLNTRVEREAALDQLIRRHSDSNRFFISDLSAQLGLLVAEKSDIQTALSYLAGAYQLNPYNQLAFEKYLELAQGQEDLSIPVTAQLLHFRRLLSLNPFDLDTAMLYADGLQNVQLYDAASDAYGYAAQVFDVLYPDQPLLKEILHPWLLSTYHSRIHRPNCLKIADKYRDADQFDLVLEAMVGKTLIRLGQVETGERVLAEAAEEAEKQVGTGETVFPEYLAWFYSFISLQPEKALAWSNQAFQEDPNRPGVQPIFAYSLTLNGQNGLAKEYAEPLGEDDQIASLALGMIQLSGEEKQEALQTLKTTVEMAPETLIAEKAVRLLEENDSDYIPSLSPDTVREELENGYQYDLIPEFVDPSKRFTVKLLFNGSDFLYGEDFPARLVIENTSSEPLIFSDKGMLKGNIRVDVALEGNLNVEIGNLLVKQYRPSDTVEPGKYISIPLDLNRGRLRKLLLTYPQADVWMNFSVTLDSDKNTVQTRIHRRGVEMTRDYLIQRLDVLSKGQLGQKYQAASLFVGLLAEQKAFALSQADFTHIQVEPSLIRDSVRKMLTDEDWKIRVHTLNALLSVSIPLDIGVVNEVSKNLSHEKWPVRLIAMYLLAKSQPDSFRKVLDWTAQQDAFPLNRMMATALGGRGQDTEQSEPIPNDDG